MLGGVDVKGQVEGEDTTGFVIRGVETMGLSAAEEMDASPG